MDPSCEPVTVPVISRTKTRRGDEPLVMLTAYDYPTASIADRSGADLLLIGDSLGMVVQGRADTLKVTIDDIVYHSRAVARAEPRALIVADMPWMSYHVTVEDAVRNAGRCIQEGHAESVKLEGGARRLPTVRALIDAEIPVMGHLGLTPQSVNALGGFRVQGKDTESAARILDDALALQDAGVFAIVLEAVPRDLAERVTDSLDIPTIGIGAGPKCDGQVLVWHDVLGITPEPLPRFVRRYEELGRRAEEALRRFGEDVRNGTFPAPTESYGAGRRPAIKRA